MRRITAIPMIAMLLLVLAATVQPQSRLTRSVFGSGGIPVSDGMSRISCTLAQPLIGRIDGPAQQSRIGFWYVAIPGTVRVETLPAALSSCLTMSNYPNPFRDRTTLRYSLPWRAAPTIEVFDFLGRRVAMFNPGEMEAGKHEWQLDGFSLPMHSGSIGVYYCRVSAHGASVDHAMIRSE